MNSLKSSISILVLLLSITLFGCTNYDRDISNMPEELFEKNQQLLDENLKKYNSAATDADKSAAAEEVGFRYMNLGKYKEAISYYEKVLTYDKMHYPALSNIATMYEEVGEIEKALEYSQTLYGYYSDSPEVVGDLVKLLIANGNPDEALKVINQFENTEKGKSNPEFIESLRKTIPQS